MYICIYSCGCLYVCRSVCACARACEEFCHSAELHNGRLIGLSVDKKEEHKSIFLVCFSETDGFDYM